MIYVIILVSLVFWVSNINVSGSPMTGLHYPFVGWEDVTIGACLYPWKQSQVCMIASEIICVSSQLALEKIEYD